MNIITKFTPPCIEDDSFSCVVEIKGDPEATWVYLINLLQCVFNKENNKEILDQIHNILYKSDNINLDRSNYTSISEFITHFYAKEIELLSPLCKNKKHAYSLICRGISMSSILDKNIYDSSEHELSFHIRIDTIPFQFIYSTEGKEDTITFKISLNALTQLIELEILPFDEHIKDMVNYRIIEYHGVPYIINLTNSKQHVEITHDTNLELSI